MPHVMRMQQVDQKHTPTPYRRAGYVNENPFSAGELVSHVQTSAGISFDINTPPIVTKEEAAQLRDFIVTACNEYESLKSSHAALVEALEDCERLLTDGMTEAEVQEHELDNHEAKDCYLCQARAALTLAKGGK